MAEQNSHESKQKLIALLKELHVPHYDGGGAVQTSGASSPLNGFGLAGSLTSQNSYSAAQAPTTQINYAPTVGQAAANQQAGYGNFQNIQGQQQQLANQLGQQAQGQGPNPAQAQFAQNSANNISAQAALQAGQRGSSANAGMAARQAGQAGGAMQQNAAGQAATLQAQQQLAAQQQQAALFGQMGGQNIGEQQSNAGMFGAAAGANNQQNMGNINNAAMMQGINATVSQNNANAVNNTQGGIFGAMSLGFGAKGGKVGNLPHYDEGGDVGGDSGGDSGGDDSSGGDNDSSDDNSDPSKQKKSMKLEAGAPTAMPYAPAGLSSVGQSSLKPSGGGTSGLASIGSLAAAMNKGGKFTDFSGYKYARGENVNAMISPGEIFLDPEEAQAVAGNKDNASRIVPAAKHVPGKAKVKGNSLKNDTVPARLPEGGVVLPRTVAKSKNLPEDAARFVAAALSKKKGKK